MIVIHVHNIKTLRDRSEGNFWAYRPATACLATIDIEYNKRLDRQRPCLEGDLTAGSNL